MNEASCGSRGRRRQALILVAAVAGIVLLAACGGGSSGSSGAHASTYIYWASGSSTIGRANLKGAAVNQRFITGADMPDALTVDSRYVYWANWGNGTIGRASLNGSGVNQRFITVRRGRPVGVAVDSGP